MAASARCVSTSRTGVWRGDKASPRYAYAYGTLEILSPSREHQRIKSFIGRIVEAYAMAVGIDFTPLGSWTLRNAKAERGLEPDECYALGGADKSRPDLAIEVIRTSGGLNKLEIYRALDVPEVWMVRDGVIQVWQLTGGTYERLEKSPAFPGLDLAYVMELIDEPTASGAMRRMTARVNGTL